MYLVVECTTACAPRVRGFCRAGDANVLSTTSRAPAASATCAHAAMSAMRSSGLDGVSNHSTLVSPGRMVAAASPAEADGTKLCVTPHLAST